ncbi:MAG TPA: hypothetical protein VG737_01605 [Cyclobacteriaceae bacterium]|nr:hypothetical protein [Cyclobacteriaceae bacterium]
MKVKVSSILATFAAVFLITLSAQAQDELPILELQDPNHRELNLNEDKTLIYDHPGHTSVRDSSQASQRVTPVLPSKPKADAQKTKGKDEDDTLSFNFLYYMFQKFKMSDMIDQN